jgi:magnesium transporter
MEFDFDVIQEKIQSCRDQQNWPVAQALLEPFHPADIARVLNTLSPEEATPLLQEFTAEVSADILVELDEHLRKELYEHISPGRLAGIVREMPSDEATDTIGEMEPVVGVEVLKLLGGTDSEEVRGLLRYDENSAGGLMEVEFFAIRSDKTVGEAIGKIRNIAGTIELVYNLYVVSTGSKLVGVVSLKDLIVAPPQALVETIMDPDVVAVNADTDQEEVASVMQDYDLVSVPVVDHQDRLIGRITIDDVVDVIEEEASEDILKMAGTSEEDMVEDSVPRSVRSRLPWLVVGLAGGLISAVVMSRYHLALNQVLALAFFVPVIIGMAGNVGVQSSAIIVRGIAVGEIGMFNFWYRFGREIATGLLNGLVVGLCGAGVVFFWQRSVQLALVIGAAMVVVVLTAATLGTLYPLILKKCHIDPAVATGPFITTSNDIIGIIIYFSIAKVLL